MCTLNCDITKDLIPSYLDHICSEESKKAVEAHLSECKECMTYLENVRSTELTVGQTSQNQLNFMKRVKQYYARKNALGAFLLLLFSLMVLLIIARLHPQHEEALYSILFFGLAAGTHLLLSNYQTKPRGNWQKLLCGIMSALGILYASCLILVANHSIQTESDIFGMNLYELGPYFNAQLLAIVAAELLTFTVCAADSVRKDYAIGSLPSLNLTCCALCMFYRGILFHMDSKETIPYAILQRIGLYLLLTMGILLAELAIKKLCFLADKKTPGAV